MRFHDLLRAVAACAGVFGIISGVVAQGAPSDKPPPDPWPRVVDLADAQVLVYQPQISRGPTIS